jgi:hypothetical protein
VDNIEEAVELFQKVFKGKSDFFKRVIIKAHFPEDFQLSTTCSYGVKQSDEQFNLVLMITNTHKDECISSGGEIEIYEIQR